MTYTSATHASHNWLDFAATQLGTNRTELHRVWKQAQLNLRIEMEEAEKNAKQENANVRT
jgi:hypothetical protein